MELDETLRYEEDEDNEEPPQPHQDNVQIQVKPQVSDNQETSSVDLTQNSETFLYDLVKSNSKPLLSNQETVELTSQAVSQPIRTTRVR